MFLLLLLISAPVLLWLSNVWCRDKPCLVLILARFPNHNDLINGYVAVFAIIIAQVQHTHFYFQHFSAQARPATTIDVQLPTYKP